MAIQGILTDETHVYFAKYTSSGSIGSYTEIPNVLTIPALGGSHNSIDVTVLTNTQKKYIPGLADLGTDGLEFSMLYDASTATSNYRLINDLGEDTVVSLKIELGDKEASSATSHGSTFVFDAKLVCEMSEINPDEALKFVMRAYPQSDITYSFPA